MTLDNRTSELIAIGASITANCRSCVEYHAGKAVEYGADEQDIVQAIDVGNMVRKGAAGEMDRLVESLRRTAPSAPIGSSTRCCT